MQPTATSTLVPILLLCTLTVTVLYSLYSISYVSQFLHLFLGRGATDTVQSVHYSDSQCIVYTATTLAQASTLQLVAFRALLYSTMTFYTVRVFIW